MSRITKLDLMFSCVNSSKAYLKHLPYFWYFVFIVFTNG